MKTTDLSFFFWNIWGSRHTSTISWLLRRGRVARTIQSAGATVFGFVEALKTETNYLVGKLGKDYGYVTSPRYCSLVFNKQHYRLGRQWVWKIDSAHDIFVVELTRKSTGQTINFVVMHLPPDLRGKSAQAARSSAFRLFHTKTKGWKDPFVIGMDANWANSFEVFARTYGYTSARGADKTPTKSDSNRIIDYVLMRNGVTKRWYKVWTGPNQGSDHNPISTGLTARS